MRATYQHMALPIENLAFSFVKISALLEERPSRDLLIAKSDIMYTFKKDYSFYTVQDYMELVVDAISFFLLIGRILTIIKMCENYCDENNIDYYNLYDSCDKDYDPTLVIFPKYVIELIIKEHLVY